MSRLPDFHANRSALHPTSATHGVRRRRVLASESALASGRPKIVASPDIILQTVTQSRDRRGIDRCSFTISTMSEHAGKVALITGITGQDGSYLTEFLLSKGYTVSRKIFRITHAVSFGSKQHTDEAESRGTHEVVGRGEGGIRHCTSGPHRKAKLIRLI